MGDELAGGLGQRGQDQGAASRSPRGEGDLAGQGHLAAAGRSHHNGQRAAWQSPTQYGVQDWHNGRIDLRRQSGFALRHGSFSPFTFALLES
jgi:hypothetical protein